MGGVDRMDQKMSAFMINLRTKKWWWPLDVAVNNAYQIYHQSHLNSGEYRLDALGFRRAIVDAYYRLYGKSLPSTTLFISSRSLHHPANSFQFDGISHWTAKGSQRRCSLPGRKGTSVYHCKKCKTVFILNVLNYIIVSRAVCKVYLR